MVERPGRSVSRLPLLLGLWLALGGTACSEDVEPATKVVALTAEELLDPEACRGCHKKHYDEWAGSMHAYAAEDPVFLAMNQRGQRETKGALGDFCVQCHAPMALERGATKDGLNLAQVPKKLRGVTCVTCHTVTEVQGDHNAPLVRADDGVMRGPIADPVVNPAHKMAYSALLDGGKPASSTLCGSCHDVVTPNGVALERTFAEWKQTLFAADDAGQFNSCGGCHMHTAPGNAGDAPGAADRIIHDHGFPGVDVALTDFPGKAIQRAHIQDDLDSTVVAQLCVAVTATGPTEVEVTLQNVAAGHSFPSGAAHDRRAWVELIARKAGQVVYQSGVVGEDQAVAELDDPDLWLLRDRVFDAKYKVVHMFWDIEKLVSELLPGPPKGTAAGASGADTRRSRVYTLPTAPDEIAMRVRLRPMGLDVLHDLEASGDLDPIHRKAMPTFDLKGTTLLWRADLAVSKPNAKGGSSLCVPSLVVTGADDPLAGAEPYHANLAKPGKSQQVVFTLVMAEPEPPSIGSNHWTVDVHDNEGKPLTGLKLSAATWMPLHAHGSPIVATSVEQGAGRYRVSPVELFMPGLWEITLSAQGGEIPGVIVDDKAVFRFGVVQ